MNKILKHFGSLSRMFSTKVLPLIIALVAVNGLSMMACDSGSGTGPTTSGGASNPSNLGEYKTYTAYDEAGNAFILVVTESETYVLSIQKDNGTTLGSSTGTVLSSNSTSYTLRSKSGSTFTVIVNVNIIVSINNPIPLDNGRTKSPEGKLSPTKPSGTATKYTVTFDKNGATSGIAPDTITVTAGSRITLPGANGLSKTGFTFGGWNTNAYGTGTNYIAGSSYTVNGNVTLYAKWDTNMPKKFVITDISSTPDMLGLKICQIGTTLEEALEDIGVVASGGGRASVTGSWAGPKDLSCGLYDMASNFDFMNLNLIPWTGSGTFDVYYIHYYNLVHTVFDAYKFSMVDISSETTTIPFSSAIQVAVAHW